MAALNNSYKGDSYQRKNNHYSRSLSYSGGGRSGSYQSNRSNSFTGESGKEFHDFQYQNETRRAVIDGLCKKLGSLHNEPLSPRDWDMFEEWCKYPSDSDTSSSAFSTETADVYRQCKLSMVDLFGGLPDEKDWKETKDWFLARSPDVSSKLKKTRNMREDPYYGEKIPMDTRDQERKWDFPEPRHHSPTMTDDLEDRQRDLKFPLEGDSKSQTRRDLESYQRHTNTEVDLLKKEIGELKKFLNEGRREHLEITSYNDQVKKELGELKKAFNTVQRENLELLRRGYSTWRPTDEVAGEQKDIRSDGRSSPNSEMRRLKIIGNQIFVEHEQDRAFNLEETLEMERKQLISGKREKTREDLKFKKKCESDMELDSLHMECNHLKHQNREKDEEIKKLLSNEKDALNRVDILEKECAQLLQDLNHQDMVTERKAEENKHLQENLNEYNRHLKSARQNLFEQQKVIERLQEEKADALRRLSTLASAKLSDNNPDITDLSDMNRPQKIAEKYSELYDNEWTDAYEYLTSSSRQDHKKAVSVLLQILESCFQYCKSMGRDQYDDLFRIACSPPCDQNDQASGAIGDTGQTVKQVISQKVVELRKVSFQQSLNTIKETYKRKKSGEFVESTIQEVSVYMDKCLEISWLACIQDPPLEIISDFPPFSKVDLNIVRKYTKSGEYVDYVIWPALLLSNDGALLSKGVVQCRRSADDGARPPNDQKMRHLQNYGTQIEDDDEQ
ncbi:uncharacterized protein [Argopecten irradians]|uniref:uncharacterized protein isoform X2 n=1 Tax=Argopecten irradians TaxID=31199 RepID=UPI0037188B97